MPPGLVCLHEVDSGGSATKDELVDIVAVHGLSEDSIEAWTDPDTGVNWLRDLLPKHVKIARILAYGYDGSPTAFLADGASWTIQRSAECLVQELYADRQFAGTRKRPIIFICHGLGGIVVKKSLVYSSTRTAAKIDHLWDQFISTFAILFFGTPHNRTLKSRWLAVEKLSNPSWQSRITPHDRLLRSEGENDVFFQSITTDFAPIMKQFHMFFFWEELRTTFGSRSEYVVDPSSAVLDLDNTEKAGIHATHLQMVRFSSSSASTYRTVVEAISRYCDEAPRIISSRWAQAIPALNQLRANEAYELGGLAFDVHSQRPFQDRGIGIHGVNNTHFYPPQDAIPDFIGRGDMLGKLQEAFFGGRSSVYLPKRKTFVVFGMGGSGKTQFCSKFAENYRHEYTSVFTIHAASAETIKDSFCKAATLGGLEATENAGRHFLSQLSETWLLVIDNADDPYLDLRDLFSVGDQAHILVTTRNPDFRQEGSLGFLEFRGLKEEEALQLLLTKADIQEPWDSSTIEAGNMIAKTLGYLALALIHAGNCIYRRICDLGDYLNLHSASRHMLQQRKESEALKGEEIDMVRAVYSTFDVSLKFLQRKRTIKTQDASDLLRIISFYHFEHIPIEIFTRAVHNRKMNTDSKISASIGARLTKAVINRLEPPKMLPGLLKDAPDQLDKYRVTWAVSELQSLSLISYDGRNRTFSLHPLVHAWARDSLSVSDRKVWASIAFNTLMESVLLPPQGNPEANGDFHRDIMPHLDSCLQEYHLPNIPGYSSIRMQFAKVFQPTLLIILRDHVLHAAKCGYVLATRGLFEKAAMHLQMVNDTLVQLLGPENERSMAAMLGLAGVLWGLGRLEEAITLQTQVVDTRTRLYGTHHEQTLQAMDQLGRSHWLHGQYREALDLQEITIMRARTALGPRHSLTLAALDNLGVTLGSWHRYEESAQAHREVLAARRDTLGDTHLDTLTTTSNLAMELLDLGEKEKARLMMTHVHLHRQQQLGKEHPWTLWALCYLSKIHVKLGLLREAEEMLVWGVEAGERSLSETHLGVLMGRGELARVYSRQGRTDEALELLIDTVGKLEASRGLAHPDCVYARWKLARLYEIKGNRRKALENCRIGLERADMRITRNHPLSKRLETFLEELQGRPAELKAPED
ncbi:hypothetical protein F4778DRAFT_736093 [Xylariomycetidae sp. FL2044]|nr:hypothetical protein F4778DRAFT_736093 [Xylariomycetidae sp. FL2044]